MQRSNENYESNRERSQGARQQMMLVDAIVPIGVTGMFTLGVILFAGFMARMWWVTH
ncbi:hypothetical protein [Geobacter sp. FeAm09]|uniref:hypothetical protein n=1 Tax=Geobacter sp. FeAm09 TaxID=2597769 RepID=UPI00143D9341|nr:hypothetical protein [Geobacter sp. FeAm09]